MISAGKLRTTATSAHDHNDLLLDPAGKLRRIDGQGAGKRTSADVMAITNWTI
jgi:hypothetical protein